MERQNLLDWDTACLGRAAGTGAGMCVLVLTATFPSFVTLGSYMAFPCICFLIYKVCMKLIIPLSRAVVEVRKAKTYL
jgi:hypothetical protein